MSYKKLQCVIIHLPIIILAHILINETTQNQGLICKPINTGMWVGGGGGGGGGPRYVQMQYAELLFPCVASRCAVGCWLQMWHAATLHAVVFVMEVDVQCQGRHSDKQSRCLPLTNNPAGFCWASLSTLCLSIDSNCWDEQLLQNLQVPPAPQPTLDQTQQLFLSAAASWSCAALCLWVLVSGTVLQSICC